MNRRKKLLLIALCLLLFVAVPVLAQRIRKHGGLIDITQAGAVTVVPASGQAAAVTGPLTVSTTLAVTGATTLTGGATVGSTGTALTRIAKFTATLTPAEVAANTCAEQTFTVTGIHASDIVFVNKPTAQAGLGVAGVRASATNTVGINFCNATASPITPTAAQVYSFGAIR